MTDFERDLLATAYHEAGHAVAGRSQGITIESASIVADEDSDGRVTFKNRLAQRTLDCSVTDADRLEAERHARKYLAGHLAQRRFDRKTVREWHAEQDRHNAVDLLSFFTSSDRELNAWLRLLGIQTEQLLKIRWPWVRGLAQELMQRKKMSGNRVRECLQKIR